MDKDIIMDRLVENSFDFLRKAIADLKEHPKFSIIHFYTAVELFLKARLLSEHWSLVISAGKEPDWKSFISGDFQSVTLSTVNSRLSKVVGSGLKKPEFNMFDEVRKHRNKAVHFFHEDHSTENNDEKIGAIVKTQMTA